MVDNIQNSGYISLMFWFMLNIAGPNNWTISQIGLSPRYSNLIFQCKLIQKTNVGNFAIFKDTTPCSLIASWALNDKILVEGRMFWNMTPRKILDKAVQNFKAELKKIS